METSTYKIIQRKSNIKSLFNWIFQKDTFQVVLASSFKRNLDELNYGKTSNIIVTTTAIDKLKYLNPVIIQVLKLSGSYFLVEFKISKE